MNAAKKRKISAIDLFCGAGGTSTGLAEACKEMNADIELIAINHWTIAVETHKKNHPWATHYCEAVERINPLEIIPSGRLKLLVASPECTHHARARGSRPMSEQSRAQCWHILKVLSEIYVEAFIIENVAEFAEFGPLGADGRPLKSRKGETFKTLEAMDYRVEYKVLNAADFGDATTRKRLFIIGRRPRHKKIRWPESSHTKNPEATDLFRKNLKPWRAAREVIDWSLEGESIFSRKKPLKHSTLERIAAGIRKFCGPIAESFLVILRQHMDAISTDQPLPTICGSGQHVALCTPEPFILQQQSGGSPRSVDQPLPTVAARGAQSKVDPEAFLIPFYNERDGQAPRTHDVKEPLPTVPASGNGKFALIAPEAFIVTPGGPNLPNGRPVSEPLATVMAKDRMAVVEPKAFLISAAHGEGTDRRAHSVEEPLKTVTGSKEFAVVEPKSFIVNMEHGNGNGKETPFLIPTHHGVNDKRVYSIDDPLRTITSVDAWGMAKPCLIKYNGTGKANSVDDPLDTVTAKDRFGLMVPGVGLVGLDIKFRMLRPHELAGAMGFPKEYQFSGNREQQVKQIGNAVCCNLAKALCKALLED